MVIEIRSCLGLCVKNGSLNASLLFPLCRLYTKGVTVFGFVGVQWLESHDKVV